MIASQKALLLDFGSVISKSLFETLGDIERAYGLAPDTLDWRGPFDPDRDALWTAMQAGRISERDYWHRRCAELGRLVERDLGIVDIIRNSRGADPGRCIRPEAFEAVTEARRMGARVGILSNELELFYGEGFIEKVPLLAAMDLIVDATTTEILKPDPRAYGLAQSGFGLPARNIVFVDDQMKNIRGGEAFGLTCVAFDVKSPRQSYDRALRLLAGAPATEGMTCRTTIF